MDAKLKQELRSLRLSLDSQIEVIRVSCREKGINPYHAQTPDGNYILAPLLAAKAQVLSALAWLEKK